MRKALQLLVAFLLMIVLVPQVAYAQEKTISGTVLSDDKTPLPGVTIRVKGTRRITQTDANGKFTLQVSPGETLQVTYVGYEPQDVRYHAESFRRSARRSGRNGHGHQT